MVTFIHLCLRFHTTIKSLFWGLMSTILVFSYIYIFDFAVYLDIPTSKCSNEVLKYSKCKKAVTCPMEKTHVLDKLFFCHES